MITKAELLLSAFTYVYSTAKYTNAQMLSLKSSIQLSYLKLLSMLVLRRNIT
jgi:hypothetical protein